MKFNALKTSLVIQLKVKTEFVTNASIDHQNAVVHLMMKMKEIGQVDHEISLEEMGQDHRRLANERKAPVDHEVEIEKTSDRRKKNEGQTEVDQGRKNIVRGDQANLLQRNIGAGHGKRRLSGSLPED